MPKLSAVETAPCRVLNEPKPLSMRKEAGGPVLSLRVHHQSVVDVGATVYPAGHNIIHHVARVDAAAPTEQRSGFPGSFATTLADAADPNSVPFNYAPFTDGPFGEPSPTVQTGYQ